MPGIGRPTIRCSPRVTDFFHMQGEEIHEVAVGPVHAGVIEPGHFRFQCDGEHVFHLEISLGYQHRGIERALVGGPNKRTMHQMEAIGGDTSIGHATAYCRILEALAAAQPSLRAQALRGVALELERLANHTGDLGALADDVGFLSTASYCGRLRGDFLNSTAMLCGNRFGRTMVRPGGVGWDLDPARIEQIRHKVEPAMADVIGATEVLRSSLSVQSRFEETRPRLARSVRAIGSGRSRGPGLRRRSRRAARFSVGHLSLRLHPGFDLGHRRRLRPNLCPGVWKSSVRASSCCSNCRRCPAGPPRTRVGPLAPDSLAVSLVEGWRGEICHVALTDGEGRFARYKIVDPSFHNWAGLQMALRDQQISDFPLCNKSFNLSYCGHDL